MRRNPSLIVAFCYWLVFFTLEQTIRNNIKAKPMPKGIKRPPLFLVSCVKTNEKQTNTIIVRSLLSSAHHKNLSCFVPGRDIF